MTITREYPSHHRVLQRLPISSCVHSVSNLPCSNLLPLRRPQLRSGSTHLNTAITRLRSSRQKITNSSTTARHSQRLRYSMVVQKAPSASSAETCLFEEGLQTTLDRLSLAARRSRIPIRVPSQSPQGRKTDVRIPSDDKSSVVSSSLPCTTLLEGEKQARAPKILGCLDSLSCGICAWTGSLPSTLSQVPATYETIGSDYLIITESSHAIASSESRLKLRQPQCRSVDFTSLGILARMGLEVGGPSLRTSLRQEYEQIEQPN